MLAKPRHVNTLFFPYLCFFVFFFLFHFCFTAHADTQERFKEYGKNLFSYSESSNIMPVPLPQDTVIELSHEEKKIFHVLLNTLRQKHERSVIKPHKELMIAMEKHAQNLAEFQHYGGHEWVIEKDSLIPYTSGYKVFNITITERLPDENIAFALLMNCKAKERKEILRCIMKETLLNLMSSPSHRPSVLKLFARAYGFAIVARSDRSYMLILAIQPSR